MVAFLLGVLMVVVFGSVPSLRPSFMVDGMLHRVTMPETIEIVMMSVAALILVVGKANVHDAVKGNVFGAGMNAMVAIFGIAWMGDTFFNGNLAFFKEHIANVVTQYPFLFAIALFFMSICAQVLVLAQMVLLTSMVLWWLQQVQTLRVVA